MNILIISPGFERPHGGLRVIAEWANTFTARGHQVTLQMTGPNMTIGDEWCWIDPEVDIHVHASLKSSEYLANNAKADVIITTTPEIAVHIDKQQFKRFKRFYLLQMLEHLFQSNKYWQSVCNRSYAVSYPILSISKWNMEYLQKKIGRDPKYTHYIHNGVSEDFEPHKKDKKLTVLVEGWVGYNHAKDVYNFNARAAKLLQEQYGKDITILCYGQHEPDLHSEIFDAGTGNELAVPADTEQIIDYCQRANFMIKASRYDARSCAPVEAMACGTPTVRALLKGDDDLTHEYNCLRSLYPGEKASTEEIEQLFELFWTNIERMIQDEALRDELAYNGLEYRKEHLDWNENIEQVEEIINSYELD